MSLEEFYEQIQTQLLENMEEETDKTPLQPFVRYLFLSMSISFENFVLKNCIRPSVNWCSYTYRYPIKYVVLCLLNLELEYKIVFRIDCIHHVWNRSYFKNQLVDIQKYLVDEEGHTRAYQKNNVVIKLTASEYLRRDLSTDLLLLFEGYNYTHVEQFKTMLYPPYCTWFFSPHPPYQVKANLFYPEKYLYI